MLWILVKKLRGIVISKNNGRISNSAELKVVDWYCEAIDFHGYVSCLKLSTSFLSEVTYVPWQSKNNSKLIPPLINLTPNTSVNYKHNSTSHLYEMSLVFDSLIHAILQINFCLILEGRVNELLSITWLFLFVSYQLCFSFSDYGTNHDSFFVYHYGAIISNHIL